MSDELFNAEKTKKRHADLLRLLKAHQISEDKELAIALFTEGILQCVQQFGPRCMGFFAQMFVDVWRRGESEVVREALMETMMEHFASHASGQPS